MIKLSKVSTKPPKGTDEAKIEAETAKLVEKIGSLIEVLMAQKKYSLLVVFQGMDASGKDGAFKNVFSKAPQASFLYKSYGKPTPEEFAHDFLWRIHKNAPAKGQVSISVRSHYEDILIQKVHNWIDDKRVKVRMNAINAYEELLRDDNNTIVLKFFLHISPERQLEKLAERIEVPEKNWKHKDGDWEERKSWDKYMAAYEYAINQSKIEWTIVPVDSRWYRDYIIAKKVYEVLSKLKLEYPKLPADSAGQSLLKSYKDSMNLTKQPKVKDLKKAKADDKATSSSVSKKEQSKPKKQVANTAESKETSSSLKSTTSASPRTRKPNVKRVTSNARTPTKRLTSQKVSKKNTRASSKQTPVSKSVTTTKKTSVAKRGRKPRP